MIMTYEEASEYMAAASKKGSILGLDSIKNLMEVLGNIQEELNIIHIAGTNGKGSVGAYLNSIFMEAGMTTARYCSPAVFDPLEVLTFNGVNISKNEYAIAVSQVREACDIMVSKGMETPTVFEIETAVAFVWFKSKDPDVVFLEVGMGGATDATNIITHPMASVLTDISMDHMNFLGNTLEEIAIVKAGIIKEGCKVFSASQKPEVKKVIEKKSEEMNSSLVTVEPSLINIKDIKPGCLRFSYGLEEKRVDLWTSLSGEYQTKNASLAMEVAYSILGGQNKDVLTIIKNGIKNARWPGRFEIISEDPLFIIDGAHNEDAALWLSKTIENCFTNTKLTYIIGVLADKEHEKMLEIMLPHAKRVYTVTPDNPRALDGKVLMEEAKAFHNDVTYCESVPEAVQEARSFEEPVLAFGSLSYLKEIKW